MVAEVPLLLVRDALGLIRDLASGTRPYLAPAALLAPSTVHDTERRSNLQAIR